MKYLIFIFLTYFFSLNCHAIEQECVILLHGLGRGPFSMYPIESLLKKQHFKVINQGYPSSSQSIKVLANSYLPAMIEQCESYPIHFITHSMGGLLLREYLRTHQIPKLSRIIMLAPPHHGSKLADLLHNNWLFKLLTGPAGQELTTKKSIPKSLDMHQYQMGIIAGNFSFSPFSYFIFREENDGKVAVSSTQLNTSHDFIVLPVSHTFMANNALVQEQIVNFLNYGKFVTRVGSANY